MKESVAAVAGWHNPNSTDNTTHAGSAEQRNISACSPYGMGPGEFVSGTPWKYSLYSAV